MGLLPFQARKIAFNLGLSGAALKSMTKFVSALYKAYVGADASLFEINPVLKTSDDRIIAVDAKVTLDDNALFRHPDFEALRDLKEENPVEVEAKAVGFKLCGFRRKCRMYGKWCRLGNGYHGLDQAIRRISC